jgi:hydroxypyruvate isomerase
MVYFAPNLSWLFPELPLLQRIKTAAAAGFHAIEFGFLNGANLNVLEAAKNDFGMEVVLFNQDVPVWDRASRGYLSDPGLQDDFRRALDQALSFALRLSAKKIMLPCGIQVDGLTHTHQRECIIRNLLYAAPLADQAGVTLTIEVLNPSDNPGYFLTSSLEAVGIIREINHPRVKFQFDTYHLQMIEGSLQDKVPAYGESIGHFQFADYPGRHEPGTGKIDFGILITAIENSGYQGAIGLEYIPQAKGIAALNWVSAVMRS